MLELISQNQKLARFLVKKKTMLLFEVTILEQIF
jgi:hypothetical protein